MYIDKTPTIWNSGQKKDKHILGFQPAYALKKYHGHIFKRNNPTVVWISLSYTWGVFRCVGYLLRRALEVRGFQVKSIRKMKRSSVCQIRQRTVWCRTRTWEAWSLGRSCLLSQGGQWTRQHRHVSPAPEGQAELPKCWWWWRKRFPMNTNVFTSDTESLSWRRLSVIGEMLWCIWFVLERFLKQKCQILKN